MREPEQIYASLRRCLACGFVFFPIGVEIDLRALYGDAYFMGFEYVDYLGQEQALRRSLRRHLRQMARHCQLEGSLFEVGCAYGFFLDEARRFFRSVRGVDIAENAVAHARDVLGVSAANDNFLTMNLQTQSVDVVCMWDTIEHVPGPDLFVKEAFRVLRPGGHLFLTTGDIGSMVARLQGRKWRQIHPPTHLSYFSRTTLRGMLSRLGFEVLAPETAPYYHTVYNILATLRLRGGPSSRVAALLLARLPTPLRNGGLWIDLGDIIFATARRPLSAVSLPAEVSPRLG